VVNINHAPVLSGAGRALTAIAQDIVSASNTGTKVSDLLGSSGTVTDADGNSIGIAISAVTETSHGSYQYSINNGTTWSSISAMLSHGALLLSASDFVRFVPAAGYNGTDTGNISFSAWDETVGTHGSAMVVGSTGDSSAFSTGFDTASIKVVNTSPPTNIVLSAPNGLGYSIADGHDLTTPGHTLGTFSLPRVDDNFYSVDVSGAFPDGFHLGATTYSGVDKFFAGTNGYITLGAGNSSYSPLGLSVVTLPMIAAQFTDIHTGRAGSGPITVDWDPDLITVTFDHVRAYNTNITTTNSYQILLHNLGGGDFAIELRYDTLTWSGSSSPAAAGWTAGDGINYGEVKGSLSTDFINQPTYSNINHPGVYVWEVLDGGVGTTGRISENSPAGTIVGYLNTTDPTQGDVHTYRLVGGGALPFEIVGNALTLKAGASLDYEATSSYSLQIETTDLTQNTLTKSFDVKVVNVEEQISQQYALKFDGVNDKVTAGSLPTSSSNLTVEAWLKTDQKGSNISVLEQVHTVNTKSAGYKLVLDQGKPAFEVESYSNDQLNQYTSTADHGVDIADGSWHHIVGMYDATTKAPSIIVDSGAPTVGTALTASINDLGSTLTIGSGTDNTYFAGQLADVQIWSTVRPDQLTGTALQRLVGSETNLVAYWRLNESDGTSAAGSGSASGIDGVIAGGATHQALDDASVSYGGTYKGLILGYDSSATQVHYSVPGGEGVVISGNTFTYTAPATGSSPAADKFVITAINQDNVAIDSHTYTMHLS
jgi:hypothetical protein